jgi:hypothetical protein
VVTIIITAIEVGIAAAIVLYVPESVLNTLATLVGLS